jgi:hypothetical protein
MPFVAITYCSFSEDLRARVTDSGSSSFEIAVVLTGPSFFENRPFYP